MARKPVDLISAARHPQGRDVVWRQIRKLKTFTAQDIERVTRINTSTIGTYLRGLEKAGYLRRTGVDMRRQQFHNTQRAIVFELQRDVGVEAPRVTRAGKTVTQGQARQQMWRTLRIIGEFTWRDLALQASTDECVVDESDAKSYVQHLHKAGYLLQAKQGVSTLARYRFIKSKHTGPKAPMVQRVRQVFDPNLGKVVWPARVDA